MTVRPLAFAAVALTAVIGCTSSTEPVQRFDFTLQMTPDSAEYCDFSCSSLPASVRTTGHLTFGRPKSDLTPEYDGLGTVVRAYSDVVFTSSGSTDTLTGEAFVNTDSIVSVFANPSALATSRDDYSQTIFKGTIVNGRYSGTYTHQLSAHGWELGSFVTVP